MITYLHDEVLSVVAGGIYSHPKPKQQSSSVFIGNFATQTGTNGVQSVVGGFASEGGTIYASVYIKQVNGASALYNRAH